MLKLEDALRDCTLALLRRVAATHDILAGDEALRVELARRIFDRVMEPGYLERYLADLPPVEAECLRDVQAAEWVARAFVLERRYPRRRDDGGPAGIALSLLHRGLLFRTFASLGDWRGEVLYIPEEFRPAISRVFPASVRREVPDVRASVAPDVVEERDPVVDLFHLLSFLRRGDRRATRDSLWRADLAGLEQEVGPSSTSLGPTGAEVRWRLLLHLCLAGGWVERRGSVLKPSRSAPSLLSGARIEGRARLLERYLRDRAWSDLGEMGRLRPALGGRSIDEPQARRLLLHYLGELAGSQWVDEAAFRGALRSADPDFLREDHASPAWAVVDVVSGIELSGPASWEAVEGEWIHYVLRGPLHWLGVVRWGRTTGGRTVVLRLAGDAGERVSTGPADLPPGGAGLSVGTNMSIHPAPDADLETLYRLESYLEVTRAGGVSSYRLVRASVQEGLESGGSWHELRDLLERGAGGSLSGEALSGVERWASAYGRFTLEGALLLTAKTAEDVALLAEIARIGPCLETRMGPYCHRIVPERAWELVEGLRRAGHPPRVEPSARLQSARSAAGDVAAAKESLFALLVLRSLHGGLQLENADRAMRRLEAALGPEESGEVRKRAEDAVRQMRKRRDVGTGRRPGSAS